MREDMSKGGEWATQMVRDAAILDPLSSEDGCDLGSADNWSPSLQEAVAFVASLSHAAAIFVGDELAAVHNEAWEAALGTSFKQGKQQSSNLPENTIKALRSAIGGNVSCDLKVRDLIEQTRSHIENCSLLCSPVDLGDRKGVVVQVLSLQCQPNDERGDPKGQLLPEDSTKDNDDKTVTNNKHEHTSETENSNGGDEMRSENQDAHMTLDNQPFFTKFAEMLPTGLAILNHDAEALFVNKHFHELTVHGGSDQSFKKWPGTIHPDDYDRVMTSYREAFESQSNLSIEFRAYGMNDPWRLFLMRPLGDNSLQQASLRRYGGFICAVVDITTIKSAELSQKKLAGEAQERKQQQERFIDMISHEIRNPLSAVLHSAEDILEAVGHGKAQTKDISVADIVEACDTISLCVNHQKTLVDDVLSFSKLDASMLSLVPKKSKPKWQMSESLKMFQPELRKRHINFDYKIDPSYDEMKVQWVMADLVRISQVLVNLMTNAIKFTANKKDEKKITVDIGAAMTRPTSYPPDVVFFETDEPVNQLDSTRGVDWGNGESLYILVAIRDTGIGISSEDQAKLFDRFRQATPKTEEMYGGSGLGLNISRKICQLHGGEIGVSSIEGAGSTFGFFIRVRRSEDQTEEEDDIDMKAGQLKESLEFPNSMKPSFLTEKDNPEVLNSPRTEATSNDDDRWENTAEITSKLQKNQSMEDADKQERRERSSKEGGEEKKETYLEGKAIRQAPPKPKPSGPTSHRILYVEDNLINQRILKRKLEAKSFAVTTANNGKEGVDAFKETFDGSGELRAFDCVLMDQEMPVMDGNAATRAIRAFEEENSLPRVHIIGVTANVREEQQKEMIVAGMNSVLSKPFKVEELVERIRSEARSEDKREE